ncbi:MAG: hypothetical protein R2820_15680 [Cyclobacteriaceae bacterium]|nr:hypothetical protein [Cyclobacteriaceae bacterium]
MVGRLIVFLFVFSASTSVLAQKKKSDKNEPNSLDNGRLEEKYVPKAAKSKKKKSGPSYEARNDFEERMEKNWKEREREEKNFSGERKADKSQPPYFGHKRPPKIRPMGKRKVCKVCGIKH